LYAAGASSAAPPRSSMPCAASSAWTAGKSIAPGLMRPRRFIRRASGWRGQRLLFVSSLRGSQKSQSRTEHSIRVPIFPAAFVRDIARPAPWIVE
jgi:hypothetical protein